MTSSTASGLLSDVEPESPFLESGWLRPRYWNWRVGVLFALACLLGSWTVIRLAQPQYLSEAVVSFEPRSDRQLSGPMIQKLVPSYVAFAGSDFVAGRTTKQLEIPTGLVAGALSAGVQPESANLTVKAVTGDPNTAYSIAQAVVEQVLEEAESDDLMKARVVSPAQFEGSPSGSDRSQRLAAATLASVIAGMGVAYGLGRRAESRALRRDPVDSGESLPDEAAVPAGQDRER